MHFARFDDLFPTLHGEDTRTFADVSYDTGPRTLCINELFCTDPGCDCRRVLLQITDIPTPDRPHPPILATVSYGWEDFAFYRKWSSFLDDDEVREMMGPSLAPMAPQSEEAEDLLLIAQALVDAPDWVDRLRSHYRVMHHTVDQEDSFDEPPPRNRAQRRAAERRRRKLRRRARAIA